MFGINKNKKETLHQGGKIGVNPRPTSQPPSASGESKNKEEIEMTICDRLKEILRQRPFFSCVGGCGVDLSEGQDDCMSSEGVWFKYCPFCGKKIISRRKENGSWEWFEE